MKFKVGDKVKNIITGNVGVVRAIEKSYTIDGFKFEEEVNKNTGIFNRIYYVSYSENLSRWQTVVEIEKVEEILDEKEKEYLSNLIKPFKDRIKFICKRDAFTISNCEFIIIDVLLPDDTARDMKAFRDTITLPMFKKNTMYKGMETYKKYTLKELNID